MPIKQSDLRQLASGYKGLLFEDYQRKMIGAKKAFLCHSHNDKKLVEGLLNLFMELQIDLYIDWKDNSLSGTPNSSTAKKIQNKIKESDLLLFLATQNSMRSVWCPWEIGFADGFEKEVLIIPTEDNTSIYGNEYLGLYGLWDG